MKQQSPSAFVRFIDWLSSLGFFKIQFALWILLTLASLPFSNVHVLIIATVFWALVTCLQIFGKIVDWDWFGLWEKFHPDTGADEKKTQPPLPTDIYEMIELFARACYQAKQSTGWANAKEDWAWIFVLYNDETDVFLDMSYRSDCVVLRLPNDYPGPREGLGSSENIAEFHSSTLVGFLPNDPMALWNAFEAGSPDAVIKSQGESDKGIVADNKKTYQNCLSFRIMFRS